MTSFVHIDYALEHPGVKRLEAAAAAISDIQQNFSSARTLATMLLAAVVAAFVVIADRLIDTWADGHLLAAWVALWAVAFAAIGLLAPVAKQTARNIIDSYKAYALRSNNAREEEAFWQSALNDPRVMAEYQAAKLRGEEAQILQAQQAEKTLATVQPHPLNIREPLATLERARDEMPSHKRTLSYV